MVVWWVMFCEVIPHVLTYWFTMNEYFFLNPTLHPIKSRVHCLGPFLSNCSSDNALVCRVICFD